MAGASAHAARNSDERLIRLYLDMLAAERGAGANTLSAYRRDLDDLSSYLRGLRRAIASARTADLRAYLEELSRRGLKATTSARRLSAMRQLYRFLYTEAHRRDDPAAVLEGPKRQRALPKVLSVAEVDRLLRAAGQCDAAAPLQARLRASMHASLWSAARATRNAWCRSTTLRAAQSPIFSLSATCLAPPSRNGCFHRSEIAGI